MMKAYILIGVPGAGKSTWRENTPIQNAVVLSTDDYIEQVAAAAGSTYDVCFKNHIDDATKSLNVKLKEAIDCGMNIIWDQTNVSKKSRERNISKIPSTYSKIAVVFETPDSKTLHERLNNRVGKTIPRHVISSMISNFSIPTYDEGFDEIIYVNNKSMGTN